MRSYSSIIRYCLALAGITLFAPAYSQELPTSVKLELTTLAWKRPVSGLYYLNDGAVEELKAYTGGFSMPFSYKGDPLIHFYKDKDSLALPPEERPKANAVARLNPSFKETLMIILPDEGDQYEILINDFSQANFPPNSCRIFNFSGLRIVFAFGDRPNIHPIAPNETIVVEQSDLADQNRMVKVQLAQEGEEAPRVVYRSTWRFDSQSRTTVFILPAPNDQSSVKMKKFVERGLQSEQDKGSAEPL